MGDAGRSPLLALIPLAILLAALTLMLAVNRSPAVPQPIAFNHLLHIEGEGLDCEDCHEYVRVSAHAGLPGAEICSECHDTLQGDSEESARVTALIEQDEPLRFNKLFSLPDHVFYTHRRHVGIGELQCLQCHGDIAETERPPERPLISISMEYCVDCHREQGETLDCNACHR
ncbi:MAG: cytochrome c3 family protein [Gemmatimonadales bacterium]|jgi:hypothetical protein